LANSDIAAAWEYHDSTKHSPESVRSSTHTLDWDNQPRPYKLYANPGERVALPEPLASGKAAMDTIASLGAASDRERVPDLATLSSILHYSAGITKHLRYPGGLMPFRAAACTGALYHIELYAACGALPGLEAGVYHFDVHENALTRLRPGDFRGALVEATAREPSVAEAPVVIICTSTFWRNSWKYETRAYRHSFWDNGTILANMLAMADAHGLPTRVVLGFADDDVNRLIEVDGEHEAAISLVTLGYGPSMRAAPASPVERLNLETLPLSGHEVDYPGIRLMHAASSLATADEVAAWREGVLPTSPTPPTPPIPVPPVQQPPSVAAGAPAIEEVIRRRRSSRRFDRAAISLEALSTLLRTATRGIPTDFVPPLNDIYLIVNGVEGLSSGTYVYHREAEREAGREAEREAGREAEREAGQEAGREVGDEAGREAEALEQLRAGEFRREAGYLDLGQRLGADAAVNIYVMANLEAALARYGNRGYRVAQLEASITAGKIYLAAYALGLGATGLTFFDDEVTRFFSPHARGKSVMFLIALGTRARRG